MNTKKEEKKNLNYIIQQNKDFSFRNDEENDENESLNLALISNSSSKKQIQNNIELLTNKNKIKGKTEKTNKIDILNQLIVNRLVQENKFIKQELEIAKSNILILEEKESQYKSTIEHMNIINKEKEISYKNIMSLINSYKKRESELNQKISLYSKELIKKNSIINKLSKKINTMNEQMSKLNNILSEKTNIINMLSRNRKNRFNSYDLNLNDVDTISKSVNIINHNRKESDAKLHYREKTLSNINSKLYDFNNIDNNYINKKYSNERLNTLNNLNLNLHEKLDLNNNINNNINNNYISDTSKYTNNTEISNRVTKLVRKKSGYKRIINNKNSNYSINIPNAQSLKKNNSYKNVGYNSVNSTINKNQNKINNSLNLIQYKKIDNKIYQHINTNQGKRDLKKLIMISPTNRYRNANSNNINNNSNNINDFNNNYNYSLIVNNDDKYMGNNNIIKNKKGIKFNKKFLINKIISNNNENSNPNKTIKNVNKNNKKLEINKYFINNTDNTSLCLNPSFRNIFTERNNFFK